jgi:hypothetical protein
MPLPETIAVRRTEEEAGYVSVRPVVRQNFRLNDLLGLVLGVTDKHPARVRQILRSGSVSFHGYHYSWAGFHVEDQELAALLSRFPDSDPSRPFRPDVCAIVVIQMGEPLSVVLSLERSVTSRKRLFRRQSFWDALLDAATQGPLAYDSYSYQYRADLYRLDASDEQAAALAAAWESLAPRDMRRSLRALDRASHIVFACPREESPSR